MKIVREYRDLEGVYRCEAVCPSCGESVEIRKSNSYKMKSCRACADLMRARKCRTHGIHSKHFPNPDLRKCRDKVSLMGWRVYSSENPAYERICEGLDIRRVGEYESANKLRETIGVPPDGTTIEKFGRSYTCGTCDECKKNNWECSLLGWIEPEDQIWTKTNNYVFRNGEERRCLNRLYELIGQDKEKIRYLFYGKFGHIESMSERWMVVRQFLMTDEEKGCPECLRTILESN